MTKQGAQLVSTRAGELPCSGLPQSLGLESWGQPAGWAFRAPGGYEPAGESESVKVEAWRL